MENKTLFSKCVPAIHFFRTNNHNHSKWQRQASDLVTSLVYVAHPQKIQTDPAALCTS